MFTRLRTHRHNLIVDRSLSAERSPVPIGVLSPFPQFPGKVAINLFSSSQCWAISCKWNHSKWFWKWLPSLTTTDFWILQYLQQPLRTDPAYSSHIPLWPAFIVIFGQVARDMITYQITLADDKNVYGPVSGLRDFYSRYRNSFIVHKLNWDRTEFQGIHAVLYCVIWGFGLFLKWSCSSSFFL